MYQNKYIIPALVAIAMLICLSFWVPINPNAGSIYYGANNFDGIRPRAIVGSIIYLLKIEHADINWAGIVISKFNLTGNIIKFISLFLWLFFIASTFYRAIFEGGKKNLKSEDMLIYLGLMFIFASSSITYITYSSTGLIDSFPTAIVAFLITLSYFTNSGNGSIYKILLITGLLVIATLAHEKVIYEIAILLVWFSVVWGLKKGIIYFAPALLISAALLVRMANKVTSGESPAGYFSILASGLEFFWSHSFNIWGIALGGGALWVLYWIAGSQFVKAADVRAIQWRRSLALWLMLLICFMPLLVAWDTSRLCALVWLPTVLVLQSVNIQALFQSISRKIVLALLCLFQALIPPALIYDKGMVAFNCYGLWLGQFLPSSLAVSPKDLGPFGLSAHSRPDLTNFFVNQCSLIQGLVFQ